ALALRLRCVPVRPTRQRRIQMPRTRQGRSICRVLQLVLDDEPSPDVDGEGGNAEHGHKEDCGDDRDRATLTSALRAMVPEPCRCHHAYHHGVRLLTRT